MALTDVEVLWNLSLGYVGEYQIEDSAVSRASKQYELCERFYDVARDKALKRHNWNEAMARAIITTDRFPPLFEYEFSFDLPSDNLRVISVGNRGVFGRPSQGDIWPWEVSGIKIFTNWAEDPSEWKSGQKYSTGSHVRLAPLAWTVGETYPELQYIKQGTNIFKATSTHVASALNQPSADDGTWTDLGKGTNAIYSAIFGHTSADATSPNVDLSNFIDSWVGDLIDQKIIYCTYIKQLTTVSSFTPELKNFIALMLASMIITPLHNDPKAKVQLINEIEQLELPNARSADSVQGKPKELFNSSYRRSRWAGRSWA